MSPTPRRICLTVAALLAVPLPLQGQKVQFQRRPPRPHDHSRQIIQCDFAVERSIRQQNQLVDSTRQTLRRIQDRTLTILAVEAGRPRRAKITYHKSATQAVEAQGGKTSSTEQPVAGKTYFVELQGGVLKVADPQGREPPADEVAIVRLNLQSFGQPNPLAEFLHGQVITVGESLVVPHEVARELLGLTGNQGETEKLSLRLVAVTDIEDHRCAVFETILRATNHQPGSLNLLMKGELTIEVDTCRTRAIALRGPVAISEIRGPAVGRFTVSTHGTLQVAVQADHSSATLR